MMRSEQGQPSCSIANLLNNLLLQHALLLNPKWFFLHEMGVPQAPNEYNQESVMQPCQLAASTWAHAWARLCSGTAKLAFSSLFCCLLVGLVCRFLLTGAFVKFIPKGLLPQVTNFANRCRPCLGCGRCAAARNALPKKHGGLPQECAHMRLAVGRIGLVSPHHQSPVESSPRTWPEPTRTKSFQKRS